MWKYLKDSLFPREDSYMLHSSSIIGWQDLTIELCTFRVDERPLCLAISILDLLFSVDTYSLS